MDMKDLGAMSPIQKRDWVRENKELGKMSQGSLQLKIFQQKLAALDINHS